MSSCSSSSRMATTVATVGDIEPDDRLFACAMTAFEEWLDDIGGTTVSIDSDRREIELLAQQFRRYVVNEVPHLACQLARDPSVYHNSVVHFLTLQKFDEEDDDENDD